MKSANPFLIVISILYVGIVFYFTVDRIGFLMRSEKVIGIVREVTCYRNLNDAKIEQAMFYDYLHNDANKMQASLASVTYETTQKETITAYVRAGKCKLGQENWYYKPGDKIEILYDKSNPKLAYPNRIGTIWGRTILFFLILLFAVYYILKPESLSA